MKPKRTFAEKLARTEPIQYFGKLAGLYKVKGTSYFAWHMYTPTLLGELVRARAVPIKNLRLSVLRKCVIYAAEALEQGKLSQVELETVLDYLFAELNARLNK